MDDYDAYDNPAVRESLLKLQDLYVQLTTADLAVQPNETLVRIALRARREVEEKLRGNQQTTDFDPLALCALQEALRVAVAPKLSGFTTDRAKIVERLGKMHSVELWQHFFAQYAGMLFEHQVNGTDQTGADEQKVWLDVAAFRANLAPAFGAKTIDRLKQAHDPESVDAAMDAFRAVMAEE